MVVAYTELSREDLIATMKNNIMEVEDSQMVLKKILDKGSQELMI